MEYKTTSYLRFILFATLIVLSSTDNYCQSNKSFKVASRKYILNYKEDTLHAIKYRSKIPFRTIRYSVKKLESGSEQYQLHVDGVCKRLFRKNWNYNYTFYIFDNRILESWDGDDYHIYLYDENNFRDYYPAAFVTKSSFGHIGFKAPRGYHGDLFRILHSDISRYNIEPKFPRLYIWCYFELNHIMKNNANNELGNLINKYVER